MIADDEEFRIAIQDSSKWEVIGYMEIRYLSNALKGIYTVTRYYTDGTVVRSEESLGPVFIPEIIDF